MNYNSIAPQTGAITSECSLRYGNSRNPYYKLHISSLNYRKVIIRSPANKYGFRKKLVIWYLFKKYSMENILVQHFLVGGWCRRREAERSIRLVKTISLAYRR